MSPLLIYAVSIGVSSVVGVLFFIFGRDGETAERPTC